MNKTVQQTPENILCLDWETSGAIFGGDSSKDHQGISFGAIVANAKTFEPVEKLHRYIQFDDKKYKWTERAEEIHGISRAFLLEKGVSQQEGAIDLASLILKFWGPDTKVMFLGHNPGFDIRFTAQLLTTIDIEFSVEKSTNFESWIQLHHVVLDTSAMGFIAMGLFKSDVLFSALGFPEREKHNALQDAEMTLQVCKIIREAVGFMPA